MEVIELAQVPDELLDVSQQREKSASLSGKAFFDAEGATTALKSYALPAYFLDLKTINPTVPICGRKLAHCSKSRFNYLATIKVERRRSNTVNFCMRTATIPPLNS